VITLDAGNGTRISIQGLLFNRLYASWLPLREASFAYAVSFVVVWFLILWAAWKRGVVLKV
jgi:predicted acyltransferase